METKQDPHGAALAGMVRDIGIKRVAEDYGTTPNALTKRLNKAGYRRSGHPFTERRPPTRAPTRATAHDGWRLAPGVATGAEQDEGGPDDWQDAALCAQVDGDLFFPEEGGRTTDARRICRRCDVRAECLEWALANEERYGVYGGKSERQRRNILAKRGAVA